MIKKFACKAGDWGSIPGSGRFPVEGNGNPLVFLLGEFHGQRSLAGSSLWGAKESDTSEQLTLSLLFAPLKSEYMCLAVLCQFLLYNEATQLYAYIYPISLEPPSHPNPTPPVQVITER